MSRLRVDYWFAFRMSFAFVPASLIAASGVALPVVTLVSMSKIWSGPGPSSGRPSGWRLRVRRDAAKTSEIWKCDDCAASREHAHHVLKAVAVLLACAVISCFNGSEADGRKAMAPLLKDLPAPLFDWTGMMPMPAINGLFDPFFPKGLQWYWKGDFVKSLTDQAIDVHIAQAAEAPSPFCLMHLYPIDGAVRRVAKDATAWPTRDATYSMVIAGIDPEPKNANALKSWGRSYWKAVHPYNLEGAYVNFMMDDEADGRVQTSYGENYARLASIKAKYDPKNLFRVNQNIKPA